MSISAGREFTVRIHREGGLLWAEVIELPGLFASGDNRDELNRALAEAFGYYLSKNVRPIEIHHLRFVGLVDAADDWSEYRVTVPAGG